MEFLVFGEDWGRHPSSSQHILQALGKQFDVHWINSIGLRQPTVSWRDLKRIWEKLAARRNDEGDPPRPAASDYTPTSIIKPLVWPLAQHPLMKALNSSLLKRQLAPKKYHRVVWAALPSAVDYLDMCDSNFVIYYCGDDFSALAGVDHQFAADAEKRLADRADLILACSRALQAKFPAGKTILLPHGVHLSHFAKPATCPEDLNPSRPSVGFYGSLNNWLDQTLILDLAKARPNIDFYFIGRQDTNTSTLCQRSNIHLLPAKPHHQLASYLQHWTMAILPFVDNPQIRSCNPLKLREYLAAGCPVISAEFPATAPYRSVIATATSQADWLSAIDGYCQWTPAERQGYSLRARDCVANESWDRRAAQVIEMIEQRLTS